jgi:hypothetical protein
VELLVVQSLPFRGQMIIFSRLQMKEIENGLGVRVVPSMISLCRWPWYQEMCVQS